MERKTGGSFIELLIGENRPYKNRAQLARALIELSTPKYTKAKSIESLLSQIANRQKPIPSALVDEILRALNVSAPREKSLVSEEDVLRASQLHNEAISDGHVDEIEEFTRHLTTAKSYFALLNESVLDLDEYYAPYPATHAIGVSALRLGIIDPASAWYVVAVRNYSPKKDKDFSVTYAVPNELAAEMIWWRFFDCARHSEWQLNPKITNYDLLYKAISRINGALAKIRVIVLQESEAHLCSLPCVAVWSNGSRINLYSVTNHDGKILAHSDESSITWKHLFWNRRATLLKNAKSVEWADVERTLKTEYKMRTGMGFLSQISPL